MDVREGRGGGGEEQTGGIFGDLSCHPLVCPHLISVLRGLCAIWSFLHPDPCHRIQWL